MAVADDSPAAAADTPPSAVEQFSYPGAAGILTSEGIQLKKGDGHILLATCDGTADQIRVYAVADSTVGRKGDYCFKATAASGWLTLELAVFSHTLNPENRPTPRLGLDQDLDTVSGGAEAGDLFGQSLALVPYRPSGAAAATESILAVGAPGEALDVDGGSRAGSGLVLTFRITAAGTYIQLNNYSSGTGDDDVSGTSETGDHFGAALAAVNTTPGAVSSTATMKLAVGIPDEAIGTTASPGGISTFSLLGTPGADDRWIEAGDGDGIPGTPGAGRRLGSSLHYTGTSRYVGLPDGPSSYGTLYALPLSNVTAGGTVAAVTTYQPGTGGLPAAGVAFGRAAR